MQDRTAHDADGIDHTLLLRFGRVAALTFRHAGWNSLRDTSRWPDADCPPVILVVPLDVQDAEAIRAAAGGVNLSGYV
jgi:hypothetical protein